MYVHIFSYDDQLESQFLKDTEWIMDRFEEGTRVQAVLITADDVLTPEVLQRALKVHNQITSFFITESNGTRFKFDDLCFKLVFVAHLYY